MEAASLVASRWCSHVSRHREPRASQLGKKKDLYNIGDIATVHNQLAVFGFISIPDRDLSTHSTLEQAMKLKHAIWKNAKCVRDQNMRERSPLVGQTAAPPVHSGCTLSLSGYSPLKL